MIITAVGDFDPRVLW